MQVYTRQDIFCTSILSSWIVRCEKNETWLIFAKYGHRCKTKYWFWEVLTIPSFWRCCSYYHSSMMEKLPWVGRKHPYEMDENKIAQDGLSMRKKLMVKDA